MSKKVDELTPKEKKREMHTIPFGQGKHIFILADSDKAFSENTTTILVIF